uniref:ANK_REP_REGION domain-containing protein n=1 Tax=Glossina austeni TaxID=7395 RepID=A0A1A9VA40_GLOAU
MNGQTSNGHDRKRKREVDDFSVKLSTIRIWMHEKDIGKLTRILWAGQGNRLRQQASTNSKVKRFLSAVPYVMNSVKDVHQAVIDNSLENLQSHLEPPVPPALVTCRDANGLNLIHKAAGLGHATILEYLIATWPDGVHETDITGKTPLHWAASAKNNMRCYTLLTQAGCDEEVLDYKMKTPTYYRHKPNEIERAFLTYVPEAPRVSPGIATDWEALSDDSGDGKKRDIKIPELNGFGRHSITESNENTSEAEATEGLEQISEDNPPKNEENYVKEESAENANDPKAEEQSTNGNGEDQEASSEEVENTTEEINDPEEDNEEDKEEEQQSEKQSEIINDCIAGTVTKDPVGSQPSETDENEENNDDDIENETEVVASNEDTVDTPEDDMEQDKINEEKEEKEVDENVEDGVIKIDSKTEAPLHTELDQNSDIELVEKYEDSSGGDDTDTNESNKEHDDENEDEAKSSDSDHEIKDEKLINIDQPSSPEDDKLDSEDSEHTSEDGLKDHENQKTEEDENNNTKDAETPEEELQEVLPKRNELESKIDDDKEEVNGRNQNENGIEIKEFVKEIEPNLERRIDEVIGYVKKVENELKTALSTDKSNADLIEQSDIEAEDDSKEVIIVSSENNSSKDDKAELNEKNYKDHFNMKNNNDSENESESNNEDDEVQYGKL